MIRTIKKIDKIAIFDNSSTRYSMDTVKSRTGCTDIINGGYFNMSTLKPLTHLKIDGIVKVSDQYKYWGYAFNTNSKNLTMVNDYGEYDNYFCGVAMVKDGKKTGMYYNSDVGGKRGRSAIGVMPDGSIVIYCTKDGGSESKTPEQLQDYFINMGVDSAIMLDSGGSSQANLNGSKITSARIVSNFICIWESQDSDSGEDGEEDGDSQEDDRTENNTAIDTNTWPTFTKDVADLSSINMWKNPYKEPTDLIQSGSTGEGAKWVQAMLQKIGFYINVDGDFGSESVSSLKTFQKYWSLSQDGQCGNDTRIALKNCVWAISASPKEQVKTMSAEICRTESKGQDDKYINWYNIVTKAGFATTVAWCAIFVSWVLRRSGIDENTYPNFASCSLGISALKQKGVVRDPHEYSPKSGDVVFFDANKDGAPEHVGFVLFNDGTYLETIEGNSSDAVKHNKYSLKSDSIYKYVEII